MTDKHRRAFTLIELIIYIAITAIVVVALLRVMIIIFDTRSTAGASAELQQQLRFTMERIVHVSLEAENIDTKATAFNTNEGTLVFFVNGKRDSFSLRQGRIYEQVSSGDRVPLTPSSITIEKFHLKNRSSSEVATVQIELRAAELHHEQAEKPDAMSLQTSITLRP